MRLSLPLKLAHLPIVVMSLGLLWAAVAVLDPSRPGGRVWGPVLAAVGLLLRRWLRPSPAWLLPLVGLTFLLGIAGFTQPEGLRADFPSYYVYLRSAAFDGDLDSENEWKEWGYPEEQLTVTGHRFNQHAVGPALLWSPFFAVAHAYVGALALLGYDDYAADGYSVPYLRSAALGTLTLALAGAWLLGTILRVRVGGAGAALAITAAVMMSPVAYYLFVLPGMAHGLTFALAAALVWAVDRVYASPSLARWTTVGVLLGVLALVRMQAAVFALFPVGVGLVQLWQRRARVSWLLAGALASAIAFSPQLVVWKILYGTLFRVPSGPGMRSEGVGLGWFDPRAPRALDVLMAADHGLLSWTPGVLLGLLGLVIVWRRWSLLALGGLIVAVGTTWFNGSMADWGGDAFGARRFDVIVPFVAVGLAAWLAACRRSPLLAPGAIFAAFCLWNVGLVNLFRGRVITDAAPFETVAARQARQVRRLSEETLERVGGRGARALAYKLFVGEYFYANLNPAATIDLSGDPRYLAGGWGQPENREGPPTFRWAAFPEACARFPLDRPAQGLRAAITARAPGRLETQTIAFHLNGHALSSTRIGREWVDVPVTLPKHALVSGENLLCLRFGSSLPEADGRRAAAVSRIQLP